MWPWLPPHGTGAIAVIRLSGPRSLSITEHLFRNRHLKPKALKDKASHTAHFGLIVDGEHIVDEVLVTIFKGSHSFTGEEVVEISCHGSPFIQQQLLQLFLKHGARMAEAGEYTLRAFLNGKFDLSQAEAVADLIASNSMASQQVAMQQMRGGFSNKIKELRTGLIDFAALIELELDFSEEDVEFADRSSLKNLISTILQVIDKLLSSFELGNVLKNGIPVAIVGKPNAGKSTLLNALLEEDRAIVSDIPGTTRDTIEDEIVLDGVLFRFIDTAGIRTTSDVIEQIGVNKAFDAIRQSAIVLYLFDVHELSRGDVELEIQNIREHLGTNRLLLVGNKIDTEDLSELRAEFEGLEPLIYISAKEQRHLDQLKQHLLQLFDTQSVNSSDTIVTNARHAESLRRAGAALYQVLEGLSNHIPGDLLALDIRYALDELGSITGQVTNEDFIGYDLLTVLYWKVSCAKQPNIYFQKNPSYTILN